MATEREGSGSSSWLAFLVGGLLVGLLVLGYFVYSGAPARDAAPGLNITVDTPNLPTPPEPVPAPKG